MAAVGDDSEPKSFDTRGQAKQFCVKKNKLIKKKQAATGWALRGFGQDVSVHDSL